MNLGLSTAMARSDFVAKVMNPIAVRAVDGMVVSSNRAKDRLFPPGWNGEMVSADMQRVARRAELFTMSKEMFGLIQHAAELLPPQTIEMTDLPSDDGWIALPVPFEIEDVRRDKIPLVHVMWSRRLGGHPGVKFAPGADHEEEGVVVWSFVDFRDPSDDLVKHLKKAGTFDKIAMAVPRAALTHVQTMAFGRTCWKLLNDVPGSRANVDQTMQSLHDVQEVEFDGRVGHGITMNGSKVEVVADPLVQFLTAFWHFCQSELTETERDPLPRHFRKALRRMEMPDGPVSVVVLRRKKGESHGDGGWELQYRHLRRGHWRKQWYGSGAGKYQRHIWIAPTVVGPEDKPLIERDVVNLVVR